MIMALVFTVLAGICTATVVYGVVKMSRNIILTGLFYYSFLPLIGETMGWLADKAHYHILFIVLFLCQLVLSTIKFEHLDDTSKTFSKFAVRLITCFILINGFSGLIIFVFIKSLPMIFGIYHVIIAVALIPPLVKRFIHSRS